MAWDPSEWGSAFKPAGPPKRVKKPGGWGSAFSGPPPPAVTKTIHRDENGNVESVVEERPGEEPVTRWVIRDEDGNVIRVEED